MYNALKDQLTERQLCEYRQWIADLQEEIRADGGDPGRPDPELWEYFDPRGVTGRQIYHSYSDEELLDLLIRTMDHPGHKPRVGEIHFVYREYLRLRFAGLNNAKNRARTRRKRLAEQARWPWDWPERVSPQPLLEKLERRGKQLTSEDRQLLTGLCEQARETKLPPAISIAAHERLEKLYNCKLALELMGIPALDRAGLRNMTRFWDEQRNLALGAGHTTKEETE